MPPPLLVCTVSQCPTSVFDTRELSRRGLLLRSNTFLESRYAHSDPNDSFLLHVAKYFHMRNATRKSPGPFRLSLCVTFLWQIRAHRFQHYELFPIHTYILYHLPHQFSFTSYNVLEYFQNVEKPQKFLHLLCGQTSYWICER